MFFYPKHTIHYICHKDFSQAENIYEIDIYTNVGMKTRGGYESVLNELFDHKDISAADIKLYSMIGSTKVDILRNATIMNYGYKEIIQDGNIVKGVHIVATDTLSYGMGVIYNYESTLETGLNESMVTLFKGNDWTKRFKVISNIGNKQLHFDGHVPTKDVLNRISKQNDCHWCVIDDTLYIAKSIVLGKRGSRFYDMPLPASYIGKSVLSKIEYEAPNKVTRKSEIRSLFMLTGSCTDDQFGLIDLEPGTVMTYNNVFSPYIYGGRGRILITKVVPRFFGRSEAIIEGIVLDVATNPELEHNWRYVMGEGPLDSRKKVVRLNSTMQNLHDVYPSLTVAETVGSPSNGLYSVRVGQVREDTTALGNALNNTFTNSNAIMKRVPICSMLGGQTGGNSSVLPSGTRVLLGFNNNNINDPIIMGVVEKSEDYTTLPFIKTTATDLEIDAPSKIDVISPAVNLGGSNASLGVARLNDSIVIDTTTDPSNMLSLSMLAAMFGLPFLSPMRGSISGASGVVKSL